MFDQTTRTAAVTEPAIPPGAPPRATMRVGIICNPKSHQNRNGSTPHRSFTSSTVSVATPRTREALLAVLREFARDRIELLVIDGGDGTVREVLTCGGAVWARDWPRIAIVPSGKTNALALDLGIPADWGIEHALAAGSAEKVALRAPIEIKRRGDPMPLRGFLFGTGAFVAATALAQRTHRVGAFHGVAVSLALGWAVLKTIFGRASNPWRAGEHIRLNARSTDAGPVLSLDDRHYLLIASTLKRLPVGLKPFGTPRSGLKMLVVDAPPRRMVRAVPMLLSGSESAWLERSGYHRRMVDQLEIRLDHDFILDGEIYPGGELLVSHAPVLRFVIP